VVVLRVIFFASTSQGGQAGMLALPEWKAFAQTLRVYTIEHRPQIERTLRELSDSAAGAESRI